MSITICCTSTTAIDYGECMNHALGANVILRSADDFFKNPRSFDRTNIYIDALSHCDIYYSTALLPFIQEHQPDTMLLRDPNTIMNVVTYLPCKPSILVYTAITRRLHLNF